MLVCVPVNQPSTLTFTHLAFIQSELQAMDTSGSDYSVSSEHAPLQQQGRLSSSANQSASVLCIYTDMKVMAVILVLQGGNTHI